MTDLKTAVMKAAECEQDVIASNGDVFLCAKNVFPLVERLAECAAVLGVLIEDTDNYESWVKTKDALAALRELVEK
jgi:hypothetical protein